MAPVVILIQLMLHSPAIKGKTEAVMHNSANGSYDIYDITSDGSKVVALYKGQGTIKTAELAVEGDKINFNNTITLESATAPHSVVTNGTDIVVAGVSGNKLQVYHNGTFKNDIDVDVKTGTKVSAIYIDGNFYAVYTDNSDNIVKTIIN